jgi:hypothetical protein
MIDILSPIVDDVIIVKNRDGDVYWPEFDLDDIGDISHCEAYRIKTSEEPVLEIEGTLIPFSCPCLTRDNWNMISYLHTECYPIEDMLYPIEDDLIIVKNEEGLVYWLTHFLL